MNHKSQSFYFVVFLKSLSRCQTCDLLQRISSMSGSSHLKKQTYIQITGSLLSREVRVLAATYMCELEACSDATRALHFTAHFQSVNKISK